MNTKGMERIGKGAFSTAYRASKKTVLVKSRDNVKECMALGWFPYSTLFPQIEVVGSSDCGEWSFYRMEYYPKVSSLKNNLSAFDWEFYKVMKDLYDNSVSHMLNYFTLFEMWHAIFDSIPNKFHHRRAMLKEALDGLANYGLDICFEISPRNVAVKNGKLILLDCFFFKSQL